MKYLMTLLLLSSPSAFADEWTQADPWREVAFLGVDNAELNPVLGTHQSVSRVNNYFALTTATNAAIAVLLPRGWREGFQCRSVGFEIGLTAHNRHIGIRSKF
jgi:hypothetical protein